MSPNPQPLNINLGKLSELALTTKEDIDGKSCAKVTFECNLEPKDIARILNARRSHCDMTAFLQSQNCPTDLAVTQLSLFTGEIVEERR